MAGVSMVECKIFCKKSAGMGVVISHPAASQKYISYL